MLIIVGAATFSLPFGFSDGGPPKELPPLRRYEAPAFPLSLRLTRISDGYATIAMTIDADGKVEDSVALEATHPAFVDAVREALASWQFGPAQTTTDPRREVIKFDFRRTAMVANLNQREASKSFFPEAPLQDAPPVRTVEWSALAKAPVRIAGTAPEYPEALRAERARGHASVSFIVDADGNVRVPVVTSSSHPEFGAAVLEAVRTWRFAPLVHEGMPVNALAQRSFSFGGRHE